MPYHILETTVENFEDDVAALSGIRIINVVPTETGLAVVYEIFYTPTTRTEPDLASRSIGLKSTR